LLILVLQNSREPSEKMTPEVGKIVISQMKDVVTGADGR